MKIGQLLCEDAGVGAPNVSRNSDGSLCSLDMNSKDVQTGF